MTSFDCIWPKVISGGFCVGFFSGEKNPSEKDIKTDALLYFCCHVNLLNTHITELNKWTSGLERKWWWGFFRNHATSKTFFKKKYYKSIALNWLSPQPLILIRKDVLSRWVILYEPYETISIVSELGFVAFASSILLNVFFLKKNKPKEKNIA